MKKKTLLRIFASALCSVLLISTFAACRPQESTSEENNSTTQELEVVEGEYLYRNGVSGYTVVVPDEANLYEELAASELAKNLEKAA